jgi:hypothetical protein
MTLAAIDRLVHHATILKLSPPRRSTVSAVPDVLQPTPQSRIASDRR